MAPDPTSGESEVPKKPTVPISVKPSDILTVLQGLGRQVDKLDTNVDNERKARVAQTESRDNQIKWGKRLLVGIALLAIFALVGTIASFVTARNLKKETTIRNQIQQASLAGICGITNVNRIGVQNLITDFQRSGVPVKDTSVFARQRGLWTPIDCRALVSPEVGVQLCLLYPQVEDPATGKPVETTIDPLNKKNCPKSELPAPIEDSTSTSVSK